MVLTSTMVAVSVTDFALAQESGLIPLSHVNLAFSFSKILECG